MGQVIQGPWKPLAERAQPQQVRGTSQCTIIRLRPFRIRPTDARVQAEMAALQAEAGKSVAPAV